MKNLGVFLGLAGVSTALLFSGCDDLPGDRIVLPLGGAPSTIGDGDLPNIPAGLGVGEDCSDDACRPGLVCEDNVCALAMSQSLGEACLIGPECEDGLQCGIAPCALGFCPVCVPAGEGKASESCKTDVDCSSGLRCALNGFSLECAPYGEGDLQDPCLLQTDCYQGLYCTFEDGAKTGQCSPPEPPLGVPLWEGVSCPQPDDDNVETLFSVPGAEGTPSDATFFDLPFPSDIRLGSNGRPDLEGFPTPGPGLLGVDMVARYVAAVEAKSEGWSTNPTIFFRFSGAIEFESLETPEGDARRVDFRDLDSDGSDRPGLRWRSGGRTNYVCDDWIAIRPSDALIPEHTYAFWITADAQARNGGDIKRSPQFDAMLADTAPDDAKLASAYPKFKKFRDFLDAEGIDPDTILTATVFTTEDPLRVMRTLADNVENAAMPTASEWVKCGGSAVSPCSQADEAEGRACGEGTSEYDEYQALLEIPIFQEGDAPYLTEGGAIQSSLERTEKICMSMSIPKGTAPGTGWPLVVYGHGTGGSFRGPLRDSVAGALASTSPAFATLGFDEVQHGPRRGEGEGADNDPDNLFFNFLNPDAARGNPLQGAADLLSVLRFAAQGSLASASETGADAIDVDPTKIFLYGHSQGSTHASLALPFSDYPGAVLSGNGGGIVEALLNKTNPVNIAAAIPFVIQDADDQGELVMGDKHPVLALLQHYIDPADPANFAPLVWHRPDEGQEPKHVFQTFGLDDSYSPPATLKRYLYGARLTLAAPPSGVDPEGENYLGLIPSDTPVSGNVGTDPFYTAVTRQYEPAAGSDGHFVADDVQAANDDVVGFLSALGNGMTPTVPAP